VTDFRKDVQTLNTNVVSSVSFDSMGVFDNKKSGKNSKRKQEPETPKEPEINREDIIAQYIKQQKYDRCSKFPIRFPQEIRSISIHVGMFFVLSWFSLLCFASLLMFSFSSLLFSSLSLFRSTRFAQPSSLSYSRYFNI
jgi:hypothetical protein